MGLRLLTEEDKNELKRYTDSEVLIAKNGATDAWTVSKEANTKAENAELIAKGRATGYVFDNYSELTNWLSVSSNKEKLVLGDNLYIRDVGVPDYWWDGSAIHPLETQKVDLPEYASKAELIELENSLGKNVADASLKAESAINQIGDIDTALDAILAIQNELIGGDA